MSSTATPGSQTIPGVLSSAEAYAWSALFHKAAGTLDRDLEQRRRRLGELPGEGSGIRSGITLAQQILSPAGSTAVSWGRAAEILSICAALLVPLEKTYQRAIALLNSAGEAFPILDAILRDISAFGSAVDWACAEVISEVCTPAVPTGGRTLKDFETLPSQAIHEVLYPDAPQELQALVDSHPEAHILELGSGIATIAIGNVDTAKTITTVVMGVGSANPESWPQRYKQAQAIAQATGQPTVLWLGYRAPDSVISATAHEPARQAARALYDFQTSLAARNPEAHTTVVGYSYGSVVVGATKDLPVDDIVLIGSPGATVSSAQELGQPRTRVHALTVPYDPIAATTSSRFGVHGIDPTSPEFGADVWRSSSTGGHDDYWTDPEFLSRLDSLDNVQADSSHSTHSPGGTRTLLGVPRRGCTK